MFRGVCLIVFTLLCLSSCSTKKSILETREDISFSVGADQTTLFTYNMYWYIPLSAQKLRSDQRLLAMLGVGERQPLSVGNENKLKLEELAVKKLSKKLKEQSDCANGHKIDNTLWYDRSIQLSGSCW